jgi:tetratricopeptide (TPR) repeat protein
MTSLPHVQRGKRYLDKRKYERAIQELEKAANEEGDIYYYIDVYSHLGDAYAANGQKQNAISIYRNAVQIINLKLREISARRYELRRELNFKSHAGIREIQEEDMRLADEEWNLNEKKKNIEKKIENLLDKI